jgi:hypothetical protein
MEAEPALGTSCFLKRFGQSPRQKKEILAVRHASLSKPIGIEFNMYL